MARRHNPDMTTPRWPHPSRDALLLAVASGADARTCERAIRSGVHVIRTEKVRVEIEIAARDLGIALGAESGEEKTG